MNCVRRSKANRRPRASRFSAMPSHPASGTHDDRYGTVTNADSAGIRLCSMRQAGGNQPCAYPDLLRRVPRIASPESNTYPRTTDSWRSAESAGVRPAGSRSHRAPATRSCSRHPNRRADDGGRAQRGVARISTARSGCVACVEGTTSLRKIVAFTRVSAAPNSAAGS